MKEQEIRKLFGICESPLLVAINYENVSKTVVKKEKSRGTKREREKERGRKREREREERE